MPIIPISTFDAAIAPASMHENTSIHYIENLEPTEKSNMMTERVAGAGAPGQIKVGIHIITSLMCTLHAMIKAL
jgi:hypothetical protein